MNPLEAVKSSGYAPGNEKKSWTVKKNKSAAEERGKITPLGGKSAIYPSKLIGEGKAATGPFREKAPPHGGRR
jgi:hypothetical protein